jgi:hypothetical protein
MKHNAWAHENEYRLIDIDIDNLLLCLIAETDSNGKGYNLSHDAAGLQVEEIYLGPYFDDSGNSLSAQINEITDLLSIPKAKKTSLCEKEYKISICEIFNLVSCSLASDANGHDTIISSIIKFIAMLFCTYTP